MKIISVLCKNNILLKCFSIVMLIVIMTSIFSTGPYVSKACAEEVLDNDLPIFDQHLLLSALQEPYWRYKWALPTTEPDYQVKDMYVYQYDVDAANIYITLFTYFYPEYEINGYILSEEVIKRIEYLVEPGARNEPPSSSGINGGWHYAAIYQSIVLAKNTPQVWNNISDDVKHRIDLLMKGLLISSNWLINPVNNPKVHAGGQAAGIYSNPNCWESYNAIYQLALQYYGSIEEVNHILTTTIPDEDSYNSFVQEVYDNGLLNFYDQWTYKTVKDYYLGYNNITFYELFHDKPGYVYGASNPIVDWQQIKNRGDIPLEERIIVPYESWPMYRETVKFFFQHEVDEVSFDAGKPIPLSSGTTWGDPNTLVQVMTGRVVDPVARENLPNKGEIGMAYEYKTEGGGRSNHNYVLEGVYPMLSTSFVLKALSSKNPELWPTQTNPQEVQDIEKRIIVGMTDIIYKGTYGYFSYDYANYNDGEAAWRYYDVEYDRYATDADKAIAQQEFDVIRAYNGPRIGIDYLAGMYQAMFINQRGHAYNSKIMFYSDFDATMPLDNTDTLEVGDSFTAVVEVDEISNFMGMELAIKFNPYKIGIKKEGEIPKVANLLNEIEIIAVNNEVDEVNGKVKFSGAAKGYINTGNYNNKKLYKIEFEVKQKGDFGIELDNQEIPGGLRFVDGGNNLFFSQIYTPAPIPSEQEDDITQIEEQHTLYSTKKEIKGIELIVNITLLNKQDTELKTLIVLQDDTLQDIKEVFEKIIINLENYTNNEIEVQISKELIAEIVKRGLSIKVKTETAEITVPVDILKELDGKVIAINIKIIDDDEIKVKAPLKDTKLKKIGNTVEVTLKADNNEQKKFKSKITLNIPINKIQSGFSNTKRLGVYYFDEASKKWNYIGGKYNSDFDTMVVEIDHLTKFAVMDYDVSFGDISDNWAKEYIEILAARHISHGKSDDIFAPQEKVTRAEFSAFVAKALQLELPSYQGKFNDCADGAWYTPYIDAVAKEGLVQGVEGGMFAPEEEVTREEMIVILMRLYEKESDMSVASISKQYKGSLTDINEVSSWAVDSVKSAQYINAIEGMPDGSFNPKGHAQRDQVAKLLIKYLELSERM